MCLVRTFVMQWVDQCFGGIYRFMQYNHKRRRVLERLVNSLLTSKSYITCVYVKCFLFFFRIGNLCMTELQQNLNELKLSTYFIIFIIY